MGNAPLVRSRSALSIAVVACLAPAMVTATPADDFVASLNKQLAELSLEVNAAAWTQATYITVDTQFLNAKANERLLGTFSKLVTDAKAYEGQPMSEASGRAIKLLKLGLPAPAPDDPQKRAELAAVLAGMEAKYGSAKYCKQGADGCRDETQLKAVVATSRDYDQLLDAWQGWHEAATA